MENVMYLKLETAIGYNNLDELCVRVGYEKGGYNYFNGNTTQRGIYVYIKPVRRTNGIETTVMLGATYSSGFKALVKAVARKNQKNENLIFEKLEKGLQKSELVKLYHAQRYDEIVEKIMEIVK